jgi:hypothetical protein
MARDYNSIIGQKNYRPFTSYVPYEFTDPTQAKSFDPLNPNVDLQWAGKSSSSDEFNSYYDYYFTGEDVRIYIDGLFDNADELDLASFAFAIKQEKQPLYGFWSYNYDVMMVGTRIITGEFNLYSRYPGRMTNLLSKAAEKRAGFYSSEGSNSRMQSFLLSRAETLDDEKNIKKYWANSQLDRLSSDNTSDDARNIFSSHPPFNFVIKYGTQEGSVTTMARNKGNDGEDNYEMLDRLMATDFNERLVQKTASDRMDIVLQSVQLLGMASGYSTGGEPLIESYQFIARDMYISSGASRKAPTSSETAATNEAAQVKGTSATQTSAAPTEERITYYTTYGQVP